MPQLYNQVIARQSLAIGTHRFEVGGSGATIHSIMIRHFDATSAYTGVIRSTNLEKLTAPIDNADADKWVLEAALPVTAVAAAAAGAQMIHVADNGAKRLQLELVTSAISDVEIVINGKH